MQLGNKVFTTKRTRLIILCVSDVNVRNVYADLVRASNILELIYAFLTFQTIGEMRAMVRAYKCGEVITVFNYQWYLLAGSLFSATVFIIILHYALL